MKSKMLLTLVGVMSVISLKAQAQVSLGQPAYGGTGCPAGSASVTLSPDNTALSILFDSYVAEAGNGRRVDRKSCNISVPVQVPQGYSVSVFQVDYRGFNSVPRGGQARFDAEYFWAGARGPRISRTFVGPYNDVYTVSDGLIASAMVWSPCGASVNLRVNTSMMAQTNARQEQTLATVDSADITSGVIYHLQWRRCR
ncbi:DUF4360 domain-containing protein [Bdellovibrio bacteriovorus]|uniref:DUF4360 domain-containing protein n=1 Tax=Bdellovibrio TaxID=958 RepID=UPI0035A94F97